VGVRVSISELVEEVDVYVRESRELARELIDFVMENHSDLISLLELFMNYLREFSLPKITLYILDKCRFRKVTVRDVKVEIKYDGSFKTYYVHINFRDKIFDTNEIVYYIGSNNNEKVEEGRVTPDWVAERLYDYKTYTGGRGIPEELIDEALFLLMINDPENFELLRNLLHRFFTNLALQIRRVRELIAGTPKTSDNSLTRLEVLVKNMG